MALQYSWISPVINNQNVFRTRNFIWKRDKPNGKNPSDCEKVEPEKPARLKAPKLKAERAVDTDDIVEVKRDRVPTFNQMTDLYHHPFCLDIHVSKGSVRACFVHRVTSRVVSVAHSISKDMKFDLSSRKGIKACVAVGALLVKRAIEDDIHNAIYTPTKGDKIEGKIEVVLRGIIENGVDVKVKLKQRRKICHDYLLLYFACLMMPVNFLIYILIFLAHNMRNEFKNNWFIRSV
ncbi:uncharacterized protein LOC123428049 [Hordeum vulgare subsp. vulgare]|uniref:uncharacterized protein LOC123428049 n=1 Tax=Hordeum vulgare subsp. vulgare TaxID=112509 RepID=UPI001D1A4CD2|nr:uncharacterized protein LOC123428049 [Hordeum vulgare subsp. vulgare]